MSEAEESGVGEADLVAQQTFMLRSTDALFRHPLREMEIPPIDTIKLVLADGREVEYDIGRVWATIDGNSEVTLVVFGADDARALLGAYTLEGLRLAVDPAHARLVPDTSAWA